MKQPFPKTALAILLVLAASHPTARADIFQWQFINPADPGMGKQQSTTLCIDGAGAGAFPGADIRARNLTMAYLIGADLNGAFAPATNLTNAELSHANLAYANFGPYFGSISNFTGANFSQANLTDAMLIARFTGANLTGAEIRGTAFGTEVGSSIGLTPAQLYSTASYQAHDLSGIGFDADFSVDGLNLSGANFTGQDLTNAKFQNAKLVGTNFTGALVRGTHFGSTVEAGFTPAQLYSTASYKAHDLSGIRLSNNILSGWNFAGQNLTGANLSFANLSNADFSGANLTNTYFQPYSGTIAGASLSGADARGSDLVEAILDTANTSNLIHPDGHIAGLDLTAGGSLVVRNYHGNPAASPPVRPLPIRIEQKLAMDASGSLRLLFDADHWDSTISFAPGTPVIRGGTLDLSFADRVKTDSQWHRSFHLFDWTGVTPTGNFNLQSRYLWDQSALYTSGDVTLAAFPGDANEDSIVDFKDLVTVAQHYGVADGERTWSDGDFTFDGKVDFSDLVAIAQNYGTSFIELPNNATPAFSANWAAATDAVAPEPAGATVAMALVSLLWRRTRRLQGRTGSVAWSQQQSDPGLKLHDMAERFVKDSAGVHEGDLVCMSSSPPAVGRS
jgi:uncharacterized protein YjbI with pentapeptide repeats